ncbi:MAG: DNA-processing protein DprA [Muribaculaceae bacterium]|nr:DNA-processing protein DprA [Muribaculaceae bacterium]
MISLPESELEFCESNNVAVLTPGERAYPRRLAGMSDAPDPLFCLGSCDLNTEHAVAIVGTRDCTAYGNRVTSAIVEYLAESLSDLLVISGLAYGIDVAAHQAALRCGVPTVGVVAHGLKTIYPSQHRDIAARMVREGGALVTAYTSGIHAERRNFLERNKVIAGMADTVIVVESKEHGGALVTASHCRKLGRTVCAVPGEVTASASRGTNSLIYCGMAKMVRGGEDVAEVMGWTADKVSEPEAIAPSLPADLQKIVDHLRKHPEHTADHIIRVFDLPYSALASMITRLELAGALEALPGGRFKLMV